MITESWGFPTRYDFLLINRFFFVVGIFCVAFFIDEIQAQKLENVEDELFSDSVKETSSRTGTASKTTKRVRATRPPPPSTTTEFDPDRYYQPKNKFDDFDWMLAQV